ncbi:MAG: cytochrome c biogenesis protein [Deltaproteobacteria bacterium]|jgi:hypothetical protein|nr:cytochrome c biogenesis protein [Deltaproteobacteria bacterium]
MENSLVIAFTSLYGLAAGLFLVPKTRSGAFACAFLGEIAALGYIFLRYYQALPMTPMFLGSIAVPPFLVLFGFSAARKYKEPFPNRLSLTLTLGLAFVLGLLALIFPKDFYLPFLKTASLFSQGHLAFNVLGKAALFLAAIQAFLSLTAKIPNESQVRFWVALGFIFWTLSMLTGEVWSYLGWGLPVVWDDAVIVCFMATWFFYVALLHMFLTSRYRRARLYLTALGGVWVLLVNVTPDLGPARWPVALW